MEILKRARGHQSGEGISWLESESNVREEALRRSAKAGYTTRNGEQTRATKPIATVAWGQTKLNVWPRDAEGNLIE